MHITAVIRRKIAARKLARMVEANRRSPATQEYRRRRAAMLKHTRGEAHG